MAGTYRAYSQLQPIQADFGATARFAYQVGQQRKAEEAAALKAQRDRDMQIASDIAKYESDFKTEDVQYYFNDVMTRTATQAQRDLFNIHAAKVRMQYAGQSDTEQFRKLLLEEERIKSIPKQLKQTFDVFKNHLTKLNTNLDQPGGADSYLNQESFGQMMSMMQGNGWDYNYKTGNFIITDAQGNKKQYTPGQIQMNPSIFAPIYDYVDVDKEIKGYVDYIGQDTQSYTLDNGGYRKITKNKASDPENYNTIFNYLDTVIKDGSPFLRKAMHEYGMTKSQLIQHIMEGAEIKQNVSDTTYTPTSSKEVNSKQLIDKYASGIGTISTATKDEAGNITYAKASKYDDPQVRENLIQQLKLDDKAQQLMKSKNMSEEDLATMILNAARDKANLGSKAYKASLDTASSEIDKASYYNTNLKPEANNAYTAWGDGDLGPKGVGFTGKNFVPVQEMTAIDIQPSSVIILSGETKDLNIGLEASSEKKGQEKVNPFRMTKIKSSLPNFVMTGMEQIPILRSDTKYKVIYTVDGNEYSKIFENGDIIPQQILDNSTDIYKYEAGSFSTAKPWTWDNYNIKVSPNEITDKLEDTPVILGSYGTSKIQAAIPITPENDVVVGTLNRETAKKEKQFKNGVINDWNDRYVKGITPSNQEIPSPPQEEEVKEDEPAKPTIEKISDDGVNVVYSINGQVGSPMPKEEEKDFLNLFK